MPGLAGAQIGVPSVRGLREIRWVHHRLGGDRTDRSWFSSNAALGPVLVDPAAGVRLGSPVARCRGFKLIVCEGRHSPIGESPAERRGDLLGCALPVGDDEQRPGVPKSCRKLDKRARSRCGRRSNNRHAGLSRGGAKRIRTADLLGAIQGSCADLDGDG